MVFELVTGDYLFDPKKGKTYSKNDDHLASISELIGEVQDKQWLQSCEAANDFYTKQGKLKRIKKLKIWKVKDILVEKYRVKDTEAHFLANFLERCLQWNPKKRATAQQLMDDPWLKMAPKYDARMDPKYYSEWMHAIDPDYEDSESQSSSGDSQQYECQNSNEAASGQPNDEGSWTDEDDD